MTPQYEIQYGRDGKRKWIAGHIPMKSNTIIYIDSRTGVGIDQILQYTQDFVKYQARQMSIPSYGSEDLIQELTYMILCAIPDYSIEKAANMLTFLQNHVKNRIVNLYKHSTERCRTATHGVYRVYKTRCPNCKQTTIFNEGSGIPDNCPVCQQSTQVGLWRRYPVPVALVSADEEIPLGDGGYTTISECAAEEDFSILGNRGVETESTIVGNLSINSIIDEFAPPTNMIVRLFLEGKTLFEIAEELKIPLSAIKARLQALAHNKPLLEALGRGE